MLTYGLPAQGNGTFRIHAVSFDLEGRRTDLGTKTITANNINHTKPFGTIDTPTMGGTAYGAGYINFGWVLTPPPASIPTDGSTINVWVDGAFKGHPVYNNYRADIAAAFPGYANKDGAIGYYSFNTTGYTNGLHQISWSARDSAGAEDGIGSRYFTIFNSATGGSSSSPVQIASAARSGAGGETKPYRRLSELAGMRIGAQAPVHSRTGFVGIESSPRPIPTPTGPMTWPWTARAGSKSIWTRFGRSPGTRPSGRSPGPEPGSTRDTSSWDRSFGPFPSARRWTPPPASSTGSRAPASTGGTNSCSSGRKRASRRKNGSSTSGFLPGIRTGVRRIPPAGAGPQTSIPIFFIRRRALKLSQTPSLTLKSNISRSSSTAPSKW